MELQLQKLMETLHSALPNMSLIASDFSYLPDVIIAGDRAPLVSSKVPQLLCIVFLSHFSCLQVLILEVGMASCAKDTLLKHYSQNLVLN